MTDGTSRLLVTPDEGGAQAGDVLRRARTSQGLTLEQLSSQIKVPVHKLDALERGRYESLGDSNFTRALAMTVCRALHIDATPVLADLPAARLHTLGQEKSQINAPFRDHSSVPPLFDRGQRWHLGVSLKALLAPRWLAPLALLGAAAIIYALPDSVEWPSWSVGLGAAGPDGLAQEAVGDTASMPSSIEVSAEDALESAGPLPAPASSAASVASAASQADPVSAQPSSATAVNAPASGAAAAPVPMAAMAQDPVRMVLTDSSWIDVQDGTGAKLFSRIARAGEVVSLQGQPPFRVRIGNASAVQVSFNGQAVPLMDISRNNTARLELK